MSYVCVTKANTASENSRFAPGTILLTNLAGTMPVHVKGDGSKSSVFPVHPVVASNLGIQAGKSYLTIFEKTEEAITYTRNNGEEVTERQMRVVSADPFESMLDLAKTIKEFGSAIKVGIKGENELDPATVGHTNDEDPLGNGGQSLVEILPVINLAGSILFINL